MQSSERSGSGCLKALLWAAAVGAARAAAAGDEPAYRFEASIAIEQAAAFVSLPLPIEVYGHSRHADLRDLRIVDARGLRVPFAVLMPRPSVSKDEELAREVDLYPLPPKPKGPGDWAVPVRVRVQGDRVEVLRVGPAAASSASSLRPGGWLFDMGEQKPDQPAPESLRLRWSGPAEFNAAYGLETSDDMRQWRSARGGQLIALRGTSGVLSQPNVVLPLAAGRFVRLAWSDPGGAPAISGAEVLATHRQTREIDAPTELTLAAGAPPAAQPGSDRESARALHFDLGAVLPVVKFDLKLGDGTQVLPVRVQARSRVDEAWRDVAATVFYRLERGTERTRSPALALEMRARHLRVVPDARSTPPDMARIEALVHVRLASLVFALQGQAPFRLQVGAAEASASALPIATLVPELAEERGRFGRASLGAFSEQADVAEAERARERRATLRPWLLWAVLVAGVASLGFMVWRMARSAGKAGSDGNRV